MQIMDCKTWTDWISVYKRLVHWELELSATDSSMTEMLHMQKEEANNGFAKFIRKNYLDWVEDLSSPKNPRDAKESVRPILSPEIFKSKVFPLLNEGSTTSAMTNGAYWLLSSVNSMNWKRICITASCQQPPNMPVMPSSVD